MLRLLKVSNIYLVKKKSAEVLVDFETIKFYCLFF